jgi:hypothetical protein
MVTYHLMSNGDLPSQDGSPVLISQADFNTCCCNVVPCEFCSGENGPEEWSIAISGVVKFCSPNCFCDCSGLNTSYVVPHVTGCLWQDTFSATCCIGATVKLSAGYLGSYYIQAEFTANVGGPIVFKKDYGQTAPNCISLSGESLPYSSGSPAGCSLDERCDFTSATCLITAL